MRKSKIHPCQCMGNHLAGCLCLDRHIRNLKLQCLIFDDRFSKLDSFFSVGNSLIDASLCDSCCDTSHPCPGLVKSLHSNAKTFSFRSDQVFGRNPAVFQNHIAGIRCTNSHLIFFIASAQSRCSCIYKEHGDAFYTFAFIGHSRNTVEGSDPAVCDKAFSSVQYVFVSVFHCSCCTCSCIGTCSRLSKAECSESALDDLITDMLFLFFVPCD